MKPIISPLWFYLIGISEGLVSIATILGALLIFASAVMIIMYAAEQDCSRLNEKLSSFFKRNSKRSFIIGLICAFLAIFTPSEKSTLQFSILGLQHQHRMNNIILLLPLL